MKTTLGFLGSLVLVVSLAACAGPSTGSDGCKMCAGMAKGDDKAMKCEKCGEMKCDMKVKPCACCAKGGADGGHQH